MPLTDAHENALISTELSSSDQGTVSVQEQSVAAEPPKGVEVMVWDGTKMVLGMMQIWDGERFPEFTMGHWTGSGWENMTK